jgi:hypothetical protein
MTDTLDLPAQDHGIVRVFALDADGQRPEDWTPDGAAAAGGDPLARAFGADALDRDYVEVLRPGDLGGMGLSAYLAQGYGVTDEALEPHRDALAALDGLAVIALPPAFGPATGQEAATLALDPRLRLVAALPDPAAPSALPPLPGAAAPGHDPAPREAPAPEPPEDRREARRHGRTVIVGLALVAAAYVVLHLVTGSP